MYDYALCAVYVCLYTGTSFAQQTLTQHCLLSPDDSNDPGSGSHNTGGAGSSSSRGGYTRGGNGGSMGSAHLGWLGGSGSSLIPRLANQAYLADSSQVSIYNFGGQASTEMLLLHSLRVNTDGSRDRVNDPSGVISHVSPLRNHTLSGVTLDI